MRYLDLRGQTWWFKRAIPVQCQAELGRKKTYLHSLGTSDVRIAKARRDELETETREMFAAIKAGRWRGQAAMSPAERGALWRETFAAIRADEDADDDALYMAQRFEESERRELRGPALAAYEDALLGAVPIDEHLEDYLLAVKGLAAKTRNERRGLIKRFAVWCAGEKLRLSDLNRRVAGRYVSAALDHMHHKTAKKHLAALRGYWAFLHKRGLIDGGDRHGAPWTDQQLPDRGVGVSRDDDARERPFTDDEVLKLLYAPFPAKQSVKAAPQLRDALLISLLSGMRQGEVLGLWVGDIEGDVFDIKAGKTEAAPRRVPIHPHLAELVARRCAGKKPTDWIFHELRTERDAKDVFVKRFHRFRKALGVDEKRENQRRSLANFHSARRWFITKAFHAGHQKGVVAEVVGHRPDKKDTTFGVYTLGASTAQLRACVEAVTLPVSSNE